MQRLIGLVVLLAGFFSPAIAQAQPTIPPSPPATETTETEFSKTGTSETESSTNDPLAGEIKVADQIQQPESELERSYEFSGSVDDIIVVYSVGSGSPYGLAVRLFDAQSNEVQTRLQYPPETLFSEADGSHAVFLLPATGSYRATFTTEYIDNVPGSDESEPESSGLNYTVQVRAASAYERAMITANDRLYDRQYDAAISLFSQAIALAPHLPQPYLGRILARVDLVSAQYSVEDDTSAFDTMLFLFKKLDAEVQAEVISDLRMSATTYKAAEDRGDVAPDVFDAQIFREVAMFLKTEEPPEYLVNLFGDE